MSKRILETFCILFVIFGLTIGFSAYGNQGSISGAVADVILHDDLRITNVSYNTATNSGSSNYAEHGKFTMISSVNLPNSASTVTYTVQLTNYGNVAEGIYAITGLPSNLTYSISGYTMRDDVCDSSGSCTLGATKEITITIKYTSSGYTSSQTRYDLNVIFDFRPFYTLTWTKYNLFYYLGDKGTTNTGRMNYSISSDIVTVTATADDGYGFIPYQVYMEAGKSYVFNATSSGTYGGTTGTDTVEGILMKDCAYSYYIGVKINTPSTVTPTQTGTYCLRLDVNKNGTTHTFRNITIGEVVSTTRVAHNEKLSDVSGTVPAISKDGYTYIGYFDSSYKDAPFNYYADAYGDLYNAYGYNQTSLWNHYNGTGRNEGRRVSQFLSTDTYTKGKSQILYGYLKPTTTYTVSYNANGGSGAPGSQSKLIDRNLTLTTSQPTRTNYAFKGWGTSASATSVSYSSGGIYSTNASTTLYALWNLSVYDDYSGSTDKAGGFFTYNAPIETDGDGTFQWSRTGSTWRTNTDDTGDWPWNSSTVNVESTISFTPPVNSTLSFSWGVSSAAWDYIGVRVILNGSDGSSVTLASTDDGSYTSDTESASLTAGVTYSLYLKLMFPSWYDNTFMWVDDMKVVQR